jgi:hypothetical protein
VSPISAQFLGETAKATDYRVSITRGTINQNEALQYTVQWSGPNCGDARPSGLQHERQEGPTTEALAVS